MQIKHFLILSLLVLCAGCAKTTSDEDSPSTIDNTSTAEGPHNRASHSGPLEGSVQFSDDIYKNMQILSEEMQRELGTMGPEYSRRYLDLMLAHMNGEVAISRDVLNSSAPDSLKIVARDVLRARDQEFVRLQQLRKSLK